MPRFSSYIRSRIFLALAGIALAQPAAAAPFTWTLPAGGELWTSGMVHTVQWTGGPAGTVNVVLIDVGTNTSLGTFVVGGANDGDAVWPIPPSLPSGTYQLYIEDTAVSTWTYSNIFSVHHNLNCAQGCAFMTMTAPAVVCGQTQQEANTLASNLVTQQLYEQCPQVIFLTVETTLLNVGAFPCPPGYTGAYAVEAAAIGCCCPAIGVEGRPWSFVKQLYRDE